MSQKTKKAEKKTGVKQSQLAQGMSDSQIKAATELSAQITDLLNASAFTLAVEFIYTPQGVSAKPIIALKK